MGIQPVEDEPMTDTEQGFLGKMELEKLKEIPSGFITDQERGFVDNILPRDRNYEYDDSYYQYDNKHATPSKLGLITESDSAENLPIISANNGPTVTNITAIKSTDESTDINISAAPAVGSGETVTAGDEVIHSHTQMNTNLPLDADTEGEDGSGTVGPTSGDFDSDTITNGVLLPAVGTTTKEAKRTVTAQIEKEGARTIWSDIITETMVSESEEEGENKGGGFTTSEWPFRNFWRQQQQQLAGIFWCVLCLQWKVQLGNFGAANCPRWNVALQLE